MDSLLIYSLEAQKSNSICHQLIGKYQESYYYYKLENYKRTKEIVNECLTEVDALPLKDQKDLCVIKIKISSYNRLFWVYKNLSEYEIAYQQLIKLTDFINTVNHQNFDSFNTLSTISICKALIKKELRLEEDAVKILHDLVYEISLRKKKLKDTKAHNRLLKIKAHTCNLLGKTYIALNQKNNNPTLLDSSALYFRKAYEASIDFIPKHSDYKLMYALRKTEVLIAKKKYREALNLTNNYADLDKNSNTKKYEHRNKAICFDQLNESDSAIFYSIKLLQHKSLQKSSLISAYNILSQQYLNKGQLDSAFKYSKLTLKEFNLAKENRQKTYQLLYDNDIEKIKELNASILEKEQNRNRATTIFYGIILLGISSFFLVKRKYYLLEISKKNIELENNQVIPEEKEYKTKTYNIEPKLENKILSIIEEIEVNHFYTAHDFSINTIAKMANTNSTYISFVFNKYHEATFKQYYTKKKIAYAVDLLKNDNAYTKFSIEGLANEVGYTSASSFTRAFKKEMNVTPSIYIKELQN
ncbi:hypothetical protein BTO06_04670 [Tenacibaculum sp. SZ-18]|uniref:helix-turn-helix domain-containing protein n=1 Tax=Tenacibaculum sp. SZ-18 TaxID=754423 RepID=UPI000C2D246B|nr:AraC family transcriptional regulator [Tenacibaculum sp. SZ-18]AUC14477.1 hypothetical protein BTO06_04670 [Tenacibaculum sp. SZ-18]